MDRDSPSGLVRGGEVALSNDEREAQGFVERAFTVTGRSFDS